MSCVSNYAVRITHSIAGLLLISLKKEKKKRLLLLSYLNSTHDPQMQLFCMQNPWDLYELGHCDLDYFKTCTMFLYLFDNLLLKFFIEALSFSPLCFPLRQMFLKMQVLQPLPLQLQVFRTIRALEFSLTSRPSEISFGIDHVHMFCLYQQFHRQETVLHVSIYTARVIWSGASFSFVTVLKWTNSAFIKF